MRTELTEEQMKELKAKFQEVYFATLHKRIFELNPSTDPHAFAHHVAWISFLEGARGALCP